MMHEGGKGEEMKSGRDFGQTLEITIPPSIMVRADRVSNDGRERQLLTI